MEESLNESSHKIKVKVCKVLFYKEMWGIISVSHVEGEYEPKQSKWGNFVIRGTIPMELKVGQIYDIEISETKTDAKYGDYYDIIRVFVESLNTPEAQMRYLEAILTPHQYDLVSKTFPDRMVIDEIQKGTIDLTAINGIGKTTAKKIEEAILENRDIGALMVEIADINPTARMVQKIIATFNDATRALGKAKESLYNLCYVSGISFARVDAAALARGEDREGTNRIHAYAEHYFDEVGSQGHSWVSDRVFLVEAVEALGINGTHIRNYLKSDKGKVFFRWSEEEERISSMRMYNNEMQVLRHLLRLSATYEVPTHLNIEKGIQLAEEILNIKYTDEQKNAVSESMKYGVFVLNGGGGVGKTTIIKCMTEIFKMADISYTSCALSGKAAQVLSSKGIDSATIHRTFGFGLGNPRVLDKFEYGDSLPKVVIVDETSMVNAGLFAAMVSRIPDGTKLILVGDSGQLSGIGYGDVLRDLLQTKYFPSLELKQIHRQAEDSGIIDVAAKVRKGEQIISPSFEGKQVFGNNEDMIVFGYKNKESIIVDLERILISQKNKTKTSSDLMDFQVVVAMRDRGDLSAKSINLLAQSIFNDLSKPFISGNGYDFREGDKVIVKGNSYNILCYDSLEHYNTVKDQDVTNDKIKIMLEECIFPEEEEKILNMYTRTNEEDLFNGTMGIVVGIDTVYDENLKEEEILLVDFEGVGICTFNRGSLEILELAYAVTCHRLQGSTIKNTIVTLDYSAYTLLSHQWVYTAITRASKKCITMVQTSALTKAVNTDSSGNRQTFLGDLIKQTRRSSGELADILPELKARVIKEQEEHQQQLQMKEDMENEL